MPSQRLVGDNTNKGGGNKLFTTLNPKSANDALAHEFGHAMDWGANPLSYQALIRADPDHNCQNDYQNNVTNDPISKTAIEWQTRFNELLKAIK